MNRQSSKRSIPSILDYSLRDVIFVALVGIFFGVIFFAAIPLYNVLTVVLTPKGIAPMANDIVLGIWLMAGPMAAMLTRKMFACTLGEILGAFMEAIIGGQWGAATLISGLVQGIGSGLGFAMTGYRRFDKFGLLLSTITANLVTFGLSMLNEGYAKYEPKLIVLYLVVRFISIGFFSGVLVYLINRLVEKAGVMNRD